MFFLKKPLKNFMFKSLFSLFESKNKEEKPEPELPSTKPKSPPVKRQPTRQLLAIKEDAKDITLRANADILKYPRHILSTRTAGERQTKIRIGEKRKDQEYWWVTPNLDEEYGIPSRLSFEFDYQVAFPKIHEATTQARQAGAKIGPRLIPVGYLKTIAKQLGRSGSGRDMQQVKNAIKRNAMSAIDCNAVIRKGKKEDGSLDYLSGTFTAYNVYFRGSQLEDGTEAEKVILALSEPFWLSVNALEFAKPLNGKYFKSLKEPGAQRWYTLISTDIFVALNKRLPHAKRRYSDYCTFHPQKRYTAFSDMKRQMNRLHKKHVEQGYIETPWYEKTTDETGQIDWWIFYKPGKKAREEHRQFRGKKLPETKPKQIISSDDQLVIELVKRGITEATAQDLVKQFPDNIQNQINYFDFLVESHSEKVSQNPAGFLRTSIEKNYNAPANYISPEARQEQAHKAAEQRKRQQWQSFQDEIKNQLKTPPETLVYGSVLLWSKDFEKEHDRPPTPDEKADKQQELIEALPTKDELQQQLKDKYHELFNQPLKDTQDLFN